MEVPTLNIGRALFRADTGQKDAVGAGMICTPPLAYGTGAGIVRSDGRLDHPARSAESWRRRSCPRQLRLFVRCPPEKERDRYSRGHFIDQMIGASGGTSDPPAFAGTDVATIRGNPRPADSDYACAYQLTDISWSSPTTPVTAEANPRLAFERLFGSGMPGEAFENSKRRLLAQKSVLDFVMEDTHSMQRRLGAGDKAKLDQYLTGVAGDRSAHPEAEKFGAVKDPSIETPDGIPSDQTEYVGIMFDLMVLAFQTCRSNW